MFERNFLPFPHRAAFLLKVLEAYRRSPLCCSMRTAGLLELVLGRSMNVSVFLA
jgi:hypothetical protein